MKNPGLPVIGSPGLLFCSLPYTGKKHSDFGEASHKPSSRKWPRAIALGADAKGFIGFC